MEFLSKLVSIDAKADVAAMLIAGRLTPSVASFLQQQAQGLTITSFAQTEDLWASILVSNYFQLFTSLCATESVFARVS
jgi:hypothetical protein